MIESLEKREMLDAGPNRLFVGQVYRDVLSREAEPQALDFWTGALDKGFSRSQLISVIEDTDEGRGMFVRDAFSTFLGRQAESGGVAFFVGLLAKGGTVDGLKAAVLGSPEYGARQGNSNNSFVAALYQDVFGRPADPTGVAFYSGLLGEGVTPEAVALGFLQTADADRAVVNGYYGRFLGRVAEPVGLDFWAGQLQQGNREEMIVAGILGSDEKFKLLSGTATDSVAPTITIFGPADGLVTHSNISMTGRATDDASGIQSVQVDIDDGTPESVLVQPDGSFSFTSALVLNGSADGIHTARARATDKAGNVSSPKGISFTLDTRAPIVTISSPTAGTISNTNVTLAGHVADGLSGILNLEVAVDGGAFANVALDGSGNFSFATSLALDGTADGTHTVHVRATDKAGNVSLASELPFTLDTQTPQSQARLVLTTPVAGARHSGTARLIGTALENGVAATEARFSIDGGEFAPLSLDAAGGFDVPLSVNPLAGGSHQLVVQATDEDGLSTEQLVSFQVTDDFTLGPANALGWGYATDTLLHLEERDGFLIQTAVPITLGAIAGSRTIQFQVEPNFDTSASSVTGDRLLVYIVDPAHPTQTLLDHGVPGTPVFTLTEHGSEFTPGLVRFQGTTVTVDLTGVSSPATGQLVFQSVSGDADTGTTFQIHDITQTTNPTGTASLKMTPRPGQRAEVLSALDLTPLAPTSDIAVLAQDVRLDPVTGLYQADLILRNDGAALGRTMVVLFDNLPVGVELVAPSGLDTNGHPYLNVDAAPFGGLPSKAFSDPIGITLSDPTLLRFVVAPKVLTAGPNRPPVFDSLSPIDIHPGSRLVLPLHATDADGDRVAFTLRGDVAGLPNVRLTGDGTLIITPTPEQVGSYSFSLVASDGAAEVTQQVTVNVTADSITTTRVSGQIVDSSQSPIVGAPLEFFTNEGTFHATTGPNGSFEVELQGVDFSFALVTIHGEQVPGEKTYPRLSASLESLVGHGLFLGFNNALPRAIFLTPIDTAHAQMLDPNITTTVTNPLIPGAALSVPAGNLFDESGPYSGPLGLTLVAGNRLPVELPPTLSAGQVVTIQPANIFVASPLLLTLANTAHYAPGTVLNLWTLDANDGTTRIIGAGKVSADGQLIEPTSDGITAMGGYYFYLPPAAPLTDMATNPRNSAVLGGSLGLGDATDPMLLPLTSQVDANSGNVVETHSLVSYRVLGQDRGLHLVYNSLRADARPILHFGVQNVHADPSRRLYAKVFVTPNKLADNNAFHPDEYLADDGGHTWSIPDGSGDIDVGVQLDMMANLPSGVYNFAFLIGLRGADGSTAIGEDAVLTGKLLHINGSFYSRLGAGWGFQEVHQIFVNPADNDSVLIVDGESQLLFAAPLVAGQPYVSPKGDFSRLTKLADGTFHRVLPDATVEHFDANNQLASITDRNGNSTHFAYDGLGGLDTITDPVGLITKFAYKATEHGLPLVTITDPAQRVTQLELDENRDLRKITDPDGSTRKFDYRNHRKIAVTDQNNHTEFTFYDAFGRASGGARADGSKITIEVSQTGGANAPKRGTNPLELGVAALKSDPAGAYGDGNGNVAGMKFDQGGQVVQSFDVVGILPILSRDGKNQISMATDANGNRTQFQYDDRGRLIGQSDALSGGTVTPLFAAPVFATGWAPQDIVTGDINGDNIPDLVTANGPGFAPGSLSVLLGNSDGTFRTRVDYPLFASPNLNVQLAQLKKDGPPDVVVVGEADSMAVYSNQGDGSFRTVTNYPLAGFGGGLGLVSTSIAVGDFNGDGKTDLAVAYGDGFSTNEQDVLSLFFGNGAGGFLPNQDADPDNPTPRHDYRLGIHVSNLVAADFNGDGKTDLAGLHIADYITGGSPDDRSVNRVVILHSQGDAGFDAIHASSVAVPGVREIRQLVPMSVAGQTSPGLAARVQIVDPVTFNVTGAVIAFDTTSGVLGNQRKLLDMGFSSTSMSAADLDNDGRGDLIIGYTNGDTNQLRVYHQQADGTMQAVATYLTPLDPRSITTADFNRDGKLDVAVANFGADVVSTYLGNGDGSLQDPEALQPDVTGDATNGRVIVTGDINHDGKTDAIAGSEFRTSTLIGRGDGTLDPISVLAPGLLALRNPMSMALGVLVGAADADRAPDVVVLQDRPETKDQVTVLRNDGAGHYGQNEAAVNFPTGNGPVKVVLADLRGVNPQTQQANHFLDIVTANASGSGGISVLLGNGDATFAAPVTVGTGRLYTDLVAADANGDGYIDVVASSLADGKVDIFLNLADGTGRLGASPATSLAVTKPLHLSGGYAAGGKGLIVAVTHELDPFSDVPPTVTVIFNGSATELANVGAGPIVPLMLDVNHDGKDDLVLGNRGNTVAVFLGSGDGKFGDRTDYRVSGAPQFLAPFSVTTDAASQAFPGLLVSSRSFSSHLLGLDLLLNHVAEAPDLRGTGAQTFEYDPVFGQMTKQVDEVGRTIRYVLDGKGNRKQVIQDPGGLNAVTTFEYTPQGLRASVTDPVGNRTEYFNDTLGRLTRLVNPDHSERTFEYDAFGNVTKTVDERGNIQLDVYDLMNRLTSRTLRSKEGLILSSISNSYDAAGNLQESIDEQGGRTRYAYDKLDRLVGTTNPLGQVTQQFYDAEGNVSRTIDPLGHSTSQRYDARNRLVEIVNGDGSKSQYAYDNNNNLALIVDPSGNRTERVVDARDRLVAIKNQGGVVRQTYNPANDLVGYTDRLGRSTLFSYDSLGRKVEERWTGTQQVIHYSYDLAGRRTGTQDAFSQITTTYDNRDQISSQQTVDLTNPDAPHVMLTFSYDAVGNVTKVATSINGQANGQTSYTYDARNLPIQVSQTDNDIHDEKKVNLGYDTAGNLKSIDTFGGAGATAVFSTVYDYDSLNRATRIETTNALGDRLARYLLTYDAGDRLTHIQDVHGSADYGYDSKDQLRQVHFTGSSRPNEDYQYDANGNRNSPGYRTSDGNQMREDGRFSYDYDKEGNLIHRIDTATNATRDYSWDFRERLIKVVDKDEHGTQVQSVDYFYDANDHRIAKEITDAAGKLLRTEYINDAATTILEFTDDDGAVGEHKPTLSHRYMYGRAVDQLFAEQDAAGKVYWHLTDQVNSTRDLVDSFGNVVSHLDYDAFGDLTSPATDLTHLLFNGRAFDSETGMYYYRARYYDQTNGRFISVDPVSHLNAYTFGDNNPVQNTDPTGLFFEELLDFVGWAYDAIVPEPVRAFVEPVRKILDEYLIRPIVKIVDFPSQVVQAALSASLNVTLAKLAEREPPASEPDTGTAPAQVAASAPVTLIPIKLDGTAGGPTKGGAGILTKGGAGILAKGGAGILAKGGAGILAKGGAGILAKGGAGILTKGGAGILAKGGAGILAKGGAGILAKGGAGAIGPGGAS